jgi:hypothetical protein
MTNPSINDIKVPTISTRSQCDVETITVAFMGNADMAVHEQLKVFFDELHLWAEACRVREAVFDTSAGKSAVSRLFARSPPMSWPWSSDDHSKDTCPTT